jgi:hypothetical protein
MSAADFSPAVASRRVKYVEDFRVPLGFKNSISPVELIGLSSPF